MDADQLAELVAATTDDDSLVALRAAAQVRAEMERSETVLVRRARNAGVTWARIAETLGVSKQAVHRKYGGRRLLGGEP